MTLSYVPTGYVTTPDAVRLPVRRAFPDGGVYVLGCNFETPREIRLVADAGPLGYREIAAHGHADALAFTLSLGGHEMLVDPGTYAYHTEGEWRAYFRGTAAHNTVRVDGRDQSQPGGNFMWLRKAQTECLAWQSDSRTDLLEARHDGYEALADPVVHRRRIQLNKVARVIEIEDHLEMEGTHDVELFFHFHEDSALRALGDCVVAERGPQLVRLCWPIRPGATVRIHEGSVAPACGWVSRRFDEKRPSPTLAWSARITGSAVLRTRIDC